MEGIEAEGIVVSQFGEPSVLEFKKITLRAVGADEVWAFYSSRIRPIHQNIKQILVAIKAVGVNPGN
jgi:hypothetical protein